MSVNEYRRTSLFAISVFADSLIRDWVFVQKPCYPRIFHSLPRLFAIFLLNSSFQAHFLASRSLKLNSNKEKFIFPIEILLAVPFVLIFSASIATLDRALRFELFYPNVTSLVGVWIPLYVISKNRKMLQTLIETCYEKPKKQLLNFVSATRKCRKSKVSPISVNI